MPPFLQMVVSVPEYIKAVQLIGIANITYAERIMPILIAAGAGVPFVQLALDSRMSEVGHSIGMSEWVLDAAAYGGIGGDGPELATAIREK